MRLAATVAFIFILLFAGLIIILHFLRPDLNPLSNPTSAYAVGKYGFFMSAAFLSMSIASWSLLVALRKGVASTPIVGLFFLGVWAVAVLVAMLFPIDAEGAAKTTSGKIHLINGPIGFISLTFAIFLITRKLRYDDKWKSYYPQARFLSWLIVAMFVISIINIGLQTGFAGLCQRITLALIVAWYVLTSLQLRK